jgi:hypothetical protein
MPAKYSTTPPLPGLDDVIQEPPARRKHLSGAQRRKIRVAKGLARYLPSEKAYRTRKRAELARYVDAIKMKRGCADCGYRGHPAALDFDHLPGTQKRHLVSKYFRSKPALEDEIAKCDVVCANCHRIRTWNRRRRSS